MSPFRNLRELRSGERSWVGGVGDGGDWEACECEVRCSRKLPACFAVAVCQICWEDAARVSDFSAHARACEGWPHG